MTEKKSLVGQFHRIETDEQFSATNRILSGCRDLREILQETENHGSIDLAERIEELDQQLLRVIELASRRVSIRAGEIRAEMERGRR